MNTGSMNGMLVRFRQAADQECCPECGSEMIQRLSKKKRIFYGCSNYPNCQFASYLKPLPQPCPQCDGLLTRYKGKWAKCSKCDYRGKLQQD